MTHHHMAWIHRASEHTDSNYRYSTWDRAHRAVTYVKVRNKLPNRESRHQTTTSRASTAPLQYRAVEYSRRAALNAGCSASAAQTRPVIAALVPRCAAEQRLEANERDALVELKAVAH